MPPYPDAAPDAVAGRDASAPATSPATSPALAAPAPPGRSGAGAVVPGDGHWRRAFVAVHEASPDGVMLFRAVHEGSGIVDFAWLYANPAAARLVGRDAAHLVGQRLLAELPGHRSTGLFDGYVRAVETGEPWTREVEYRHDGVDAVFRAAAVRVGDGVAVTFADATTHRRAELVAQLWSDAATHSATGVAVSEAATRRILLCNPAFAAMHGATVDDLTGRSILDTYAPEARAIALHRADAADAVGQESFETVHVRDDGTRFPALVEITSLRDADGSLHYRVTSVQDVTERKRAEDALRLLGEVGQALATASLDVSSMLDGVARLAVPRVADMCLVELVRDGGVRRVAFAAADPARDALRDAVLAGTPSRHDDGPTARAMRGDAPLLLTDEAPRRTARDAAARALDARSLLAVPLRAGGRTLGAMLFGHADSGRRFEPRDVGLAEEIARRVAVAVDGARLHAEAVQARTQAEETARWAELLADASSLLAAGAEYALPQVARLAVPLLGDVCFIDVAEGADVAEVADGDARFERAGAAYGEHVAERGLGGERAWSVPADGPLARLLDRGRPALVRVVDDTWLDALAHDAAHRAALHRVAPTSLLLVPLVVAGGDRPRLLGLLTLGVVGRRRPYHGGDLARADELARRVAVAMDRAQLHRDALDARAEAEEASRAKSQFLATMSHELRTPLNAILGYTELLDLGVAGAVSDAQRDYHARVRASGKHLLGLINDVLDFAKVEAGQLSVTRRSAGVGDVAAEAVELVRPQAAARRLALSVACDPPGAAFFGDPDRARQILVNLLSNAVKFTAPGGSVTVACGVADAPDAPDAPRDADGTAAWTWVRVRDTGAGIPADKHEAIFEPFVQVEGARTRYTRTQSGTGLGLAISRQFARLMHGDLTVDSAPGAGATFTLWLPCAPPDEPPLPRPRATLALGRLLATRAGEMVAALVAQLRDAPDVPYAHAAPQSDLESHIGALLANLAQHLTILDDEGGDRLALLRDGTELQQLLAARHGAQRRRLGWDEAALRREFALLADVVEATLRRDVAGVAAPSGGADAVDDAVALLRELMAQSRDAAVTAYRGTAAPA